MHVKKLGKLPILFKIFPNTDPEYQESQQATVNQKTHGQQDLNGNVKGIS